MGDFMHRVQLKQCTNPTIWV